MIRYRYTQQVTPPAPFVYVSVGCVGTGAFVSDLPAQIDTAADRTVLPKQLVASLRLAEDGRALFQGFSSEIVELPLYLVEIRIQDLRPLLVRAVLGAAEWHILLGRDVLNAHRVLLDGPQLSLEVDQPT
jgi:predicted aspartyl protease